MEKISLKKILGIFMLILLCTPSFAQEDPDDEFDPSEFENFEDTEKTKRYCTQKVTGLSPTQLVSLGYEVQFPFSIKSKAEAGSGLEELGDKESNVQYVHGLQLGANFPVISKSSIIVNLSLSYNESRFIVENPEGYSFHENLNKYGLRTGDVGLTVFKPLNEKRFLIIQGNVSSNSNFSSELKEFDFGNSITFGGALVYGWKKSEKFMWGLGASRTYRGGELLYVPILYMNKTFNDKWGTELLLPARGHLRRNFSAKSILMLGYELVGNSYYIKSDTETPSSMDGYDNLHLRRSEIKARLMFQRSIKDFIWISIQGGMRVNYKFDLSESLSAERGSFLISNEIGNPLYFNVSLNLVSP